MIPFTANLDLQHSPTMARWFEDKSPLSIAKGPVGSGKTTTGCFKLMDLALKQQRSPKDGVRYSRGFLVRNTYQQLKSTTIKTWLECFPEESCGKLVYSAPITQKIIIPGELDFEVYFLAMDRPKDIRNLLSLNVSFGFFNELREMMEEIVVRAFDRTGRFPNKAPDKHGVECTHPILIADTNPPDEDHYLYRWEMEGIEFDGGESVSFFNQPPAVLDVTEIPGHKNTIKAAGRQYIVNPDAENIPNLLTNYYRRKLPLNNKNDIRVYYESKYGVVGEGTPVTPDYDDDKMSVEDLAVLPDAPLGIGIDIGGGTLSPAAVIGQRHPRGTVLIHAEIAAFNMALEEFSRAINQTMAMFFPGRVLEFGVGDPAGMQRDPLYAVTIFDHLKNKGIPVKSAATNDIAIRIEATKAPMLRLIGGRPGFLVNKRCTTLRAGLMGKWVFKRVQVSGAARYADKPDKGKYSHICDAFGYFSLGTGEDRALVGKEQRKRRLMPFQAKTGFDVFR